MTYGQVSQNGSPDLDEAIDAEVVEPAPVFWCVREAAITPASDSAGTGQPSTPLPPHRHRHLRFISIPPRRLAAGVTSRSRQSRLHTCHAFADGTAGHHPVRVPALHRSRSNRPRSRTVDSHDVWTASHRSCTNGCASSMPSSRATSVAAAGAITGVAHRTTWVCCTGVVSTRAWGWTRHHDLGFYF